MKLENLNFKDEVLSLEFAHYLENNQPAIVAICEDGELYDYLTTNIDFFYPGHIGIRSDYPDYPELLLEAGVIKTTSTYFSVPSGYIFINFFELTDAAKEKFKEVFESYK